LSKIRVIPADFAADRDAIYAVRETVFIIEQSVPVEIEIDEFDPIAQHVLAYVGDRPVGTGRIIAAGPAGRTRRIGRMAVLDAHRGLGVGSAIISALIEIGIADGCREFVLSAQCHAIPFYEKFGFVAEGPIYDEAGIDHRGMRRLIEDR
jgi:predicted GNAT family N-acyltransferase